MYNLYNIYSQDMYQQNIFNYMYTLEEAWFFSVIEFVLYSEMLQSIIFYICMYVCILLII